MSDKKKMRRLSGEQNEEIETEVEELKQKSGSDLVFPEYGSHTLDHYFNEEFAEKITAKIFKVAVYRKQVLLRNIEDAPKTPDELLQKVIEFLIEDVRLDKQKQFGQKPESFSVIFRSSVLEKPIQIGYRSFEQNTISLIMDEFEKVEMSFKNRGLPSLFSQPLFVEILLGPSKPEVVEILRGYGSGRKAQKIIRNVKATSLIDAVDDEEIRSLCLFLALGLTIKYVKMQALEDKSIKKMYQQQFHKLISGEDRFNKERRVQIARGLLQDIENSGIHIEANLEAYSIELHIPLIQQYFYQMENPEDRCRIIVFGEYGMLKPVYKGITRAKWDIPIYLSDSHFYGIRNLSVFLGCSRRYCIDCEAPYTSNVLHRTSCKAKCTKCCRINWETPCRPESDGFCVNCAGCQKTFQNRKCYECHLTDDVCSLYKRCNSCGINYKVERKKDNQGNIRPIDHYCNNKWCNNCKCYHHRKQACFVRHIEPQARKYVLCFFDFECETHMEVSRNVLRSSYTTDDDDEHDSKTKGRLHQVNCVSTMIFCHECCKTLELDEINAESTTDNCKTGLCRSSEKGERRMSTFINGVNGCPDALQWFLVYLFNGIPGGNTRPYTTYVIGHYCGRYDLHLLLSEIYRQKGLAPEILRNGNKIYQLKLRRKRNICPELVFKDSFNFLSQKLELLPKTMGLSVEQKLFFCHGWNRKENMDIVLNGLPDQKYYFPESFGSKKKLQLFEKFYSENQHRNFILSEALKEYCENDVIILSQAFLKFQNLFRTLSPKEFDIVPNCLTMASACIKYFLINFVEENDKRIAIIPAGGYQKNERQSFKAIRFLKWYGWKYGLDIQMSTSPQGEFRVFIPQSGKTYKLDGYAPKAKSGLDKDLAIEFHGCAYHGHECLYKNPEELCLNGKTAGYNYESTMERCRQIENKGIEVRMFWECEVELLLKNDREMKLFYAQIQDNSTVIDLRETFSGGRVGPFTLKCDLSEIPGALDYYTIRCFDIVSLYPATNYECEYPMGHPEVIVEDKTVDWRQPTDNPYKGIIKVFAIPPQQLLLIPVLPLKIGGKLMFPLCRACAEKSEIGNAKRLSKTFSEDSFENLEYCDHSERDQGFITSVTHVELNLALSRFYRVTHLYTAYHWHEWSSELFKPYIRKAMELKLTASGWPEEVLCPENPEIEQLNKEEFIMRSEIEYGIKLNFNDIELNEGMRFLMKRFANSMWGRWSLRNNMTRDLITNSPFELFKLLEDPKFEKGPVEMISPELFAVPYRSLSDFVESHDKYNVVLGIFTTSYARATLYKYMERVSLKEGHKLLYTDTDSIIFLAPRDVALPFVEGSSLGQMKEEHPNHDVISFYRQQTLSGGAKQYGLELRDRKTGEISYILKCRGLTLDSANEDHFNYKRFKQMINDYGKSKNENIVTLERDRFRPNWRRGEVLTQNCQISYSPIYDKGLVDANLDVYPFGYVGMAVEDPLRLFAGPEYNIKHE